MRSTPHCDTKHAAKGDKVQIANEQAHVGLDGYQAILNNPSVDVVHFTTSPGFRPRHVLEAVQAGKHVFAEKPVCVDPAGWRICKEAHELAKKNGTAVQYWFKEES